MERKTKKRNDGVRTNPKGRLKMNLEKYGGFKKKVATGKLFEVRRDLYIEDLEGPLTPCSIPGPNGEEYMIGKYDGYAVKVPVDRHRNGPLKTA